MNLFDHNLGRPRAVAIDTFKASSFRNAVIQQPKAAWGGAVPTITGPLGGPMGLIYKYGKYFLLNGCANRTETSFGTTLPTRATMLHVSNDGVNYSPVTLPGTAGTQLTPTGLVEYGNYLYAITLTETFATNDGVVWENVATYTSNSTKYLPSVLGNKIYVTYTTGMGASIANQIASFDPANNTYSSVTAPFNSTSAIIDACSNGNTLIVIPGTIATQIPASTTDGVVWNNLRYYYYNVEISPTLVRPFYTVWDGTHFYQLSADNFSSANAAASSLTRLSFFKSSDGIRFDYCGSFDAQDLSLNTSSNLVRVDTRLQSTFRLNISKAHAGMAVVNHGVIYFIVDVTTTYWNGTALTSSITNTCIASRDGGNTWVEIPMYLNTSTAPAIYALGAFKVPEGIFTFSKDSSNGLAYYNTSMLDSKSLVMPY